MASQEEMEERPDRVSKLRRSLDFPESNQNRFERTKQAVVAQPIPILADQAITIDLTNRVPLVTKHFEHGDEVVNLRALHIPHIDARPRRGRLLHRVNPHETLPLDQLAHQEQNPRFEHKSRLRKLFHKVGGIAVTAVEKVKESKRGVAVIAFGAIALTSAMAVAGISTGERDGTVKSPVATVEHTSPNNFTQINLTTSTYRYNDPVVLTKEMNQALESPEFANMVNHPEEFKVYYEMSQAQ